MLTPNNTPSPIVNTPGAAMSAAVTNPVQQQTIPANTQPTQPAQPQPTQQPQAGSLFRRLLSGALEGLSAGLQGETLDQAQERDAQTKLLQQQTANAQQQAQFAAQNQPFDLENFRLRNSLVQAQIAAIPDQQERDRAVAAFDLARGQQIASVIHSMSDNQQEAQLEKLDDFTRQSINAGGDFLETSSARGFTPDQAGTYGAAQSLLHRMLNQDSARGKGKTAFSYLIGSYPSPNGRQYGVIAIPNKGTSSDTLDQPLTVTLDGKRFTFDKGTPRSTVIRSEWDAFLNSVARDHADAQKKTAQQIDAIKSQISTLRSSATTDPKAAGKIAQLQSQYNALVGLPSDANIPDLSFVKPQPGRIPTGATVARNQTGQTIYSTDNGKSWIDAATGAPVK